MTPIEFIPEQKETYLDEMSQAELQDYLAWLRQKLDELDGREPKSMTSPEYDAWADEHETYEDAIDEAVELLDEI